MTGDIPNPGKLRNNWIQKAQIFLIKFKSSKTTQIYIINDKNDCWQQEKRRSSKHNLCGCIWIDLF